MKLIVERLSPRTRSVRIEVDGKVLRAREFFRGLEERGPVSRKLTDFLARDGGDGFFWEVRPLALRSWHDTMEFALIESPTVASLVPDSSPFGEFFAEGSNVAVFDNLGKDARLIAPCPRGSRDYAHLGAFLRHAPSGQIDELWQSVGHEVRRALGHDPLWVSTSGIGVSWLHVRLDSRPKYYQHAPYRHWI